MNVNAAARALLARAAHAAVPDTVLFARLIGARMEAGDVSLLGLNKPELDALTTRHFTQTIDGDHTPPSTPHRVFVHDLHALLMRHDVTLTHSPDDAHCLAMIIATACLRPDHLWRDLGLDGRADVSAMLERHYPALAARNVDEMRWKKFLAYEVASANGVAPTCAPGCPGCEDYRFCYPFRQ
ncbi:nitrogen fixation protein NifQ [Caballeronia sp. LP006]|uniref:nitrogen fixation protein NifQ n=1 Tax=Caballeronia sp. LP006 TaxID=3038552 RepID=UPI00285A4C0D|nr:nitrogen fixation protein NifQ [Caballeronia sp. LP006]MDR5827270.1 nitrogen fixation protein NifQ [Caballeronia sp. LP006]